MATLWRFLCVCGFQLERVLFGGGSVLLAQCTAEVAHFSLQWWTEPSTLKHQSNPEGGCGHGDDVITWPTCGASGAPCGDALNCGVFVCSSTADSVLLLSTSARASASCPQVTPSCALCSHHRPTRAPTPSTCESTWTLSRSVTRRLWVCPVMTSYM